MHVAQRVAALVFADGVKVVLARYGLGGAIGAVAVQSARFRAGLGPWIDQRVNIQVDPGPAAQQTQWIGGFQQQAAGAEPAAAANGHVQADGRTAGGHP